jgi:hypothetical protein
MRTGRALVTGAVLVLLVMTLSAAAEDRRPNDSSTSDPVVLSAPVDRNTLSSSIVGAWRPEALARGYDLPAWETDMRRVLLNKNDGQLLAIKSATSWSAVTRLVGGTAREVDPLVLGDEASDLVYFPVAPCRILDTRFGTGTWAGPLAAGPAAIYPVAHNQNLVAQGGNAAGCGVPTDPAAIALTVVAVSPSAAGDLRLYKLNDPLPGASAINYAPVPGLNVANTTIVPTCQICGYDFDIKVDAGATHVVADVVGYFWKPTFPTAGQAFAHIYGSLQIARTKGFTSYTNPATGIYCLVPAAGVDLTVSPPVITIDYSGSIATTLGMWRNSGIGCNAGELPVYTWNSTNGAAVAAAFTVFVP